MDLITRDEATKAGLVYYFTGLPCQHKHTWRLNRNLSKAIWQSLQTGKDGKSWQEHVEFTLQELIDYLTSQFRDGMSWENYGTDWHIDHIKPISWCKSHEETWTLSNLQPLLKFENLSKNNRYEGKYNA